MKIEDWTKILACRREKALEKVSVFVSYMLFRIALCGSESIPGVGKAIIVDNKKVVIELEDRWVEILQGKSSDEELLKFIKGFFK